MGQKLFIAGKNPEILNGLEKGFAHMGFDVETVCDGFKGLKMLPKMKGLAAIILSAEMQGMTTLAFCKEIKSQKRFRNVPVLLMEDGPVNRPAFASVGVTDIIEPPVYTSTIQQHLSEILKAGKKDVNAAPVFKGQMIGVVVLVLLFLVFFIVQIIIPMFFSGGIDKVKGYSAATRSAVSAAQWVTS